MKYYLKVNWKSGLKEGYFIQVGESYEDCEEYAEQHADYEDVNITSYTESNEDEYEEFLERGRKRYLR